MSKLLLDEKPLVILPSLAKEIGLNEAIILQQLHYWLQESNNERDGQRWIYNTYEDWQKQFPFWSVTTIRRTIKKLENQGIIVSDNLNSMKIDKTKWYRIDYERLEEIVSKENDIWSVHVTKMTNRDGQNDHMDVVKMTTPITREYTENTTDIKDVDKDETMDDRSEETTEKERETECNPVTEFEKAFGYLPPSILQQEFEQIIENGQFQEPEAIIVEAIRLARKQMPRNPARYISSILRNFEFMGLFTLEDVKEYNEMFEQKRKQHAPRRRQSPTEINWDEL
ncbi:DnaD domain protein [Geobacillus stearothermophilus]|uniref:DnaD domain protein n=1 Tax=Geobacillus TaxID=129337 RepID=UPI00148DB0F2|nr:MULTISPECIES: DnaD domain protein [Geobacillus]MED5040832.1 DnaD domain protein [Geobacillus stearothermophilus]NNU87979.1 DNA replication protein DnaD [Geobacillus sp. MR]